MIYLTFKQKRIIEKMDSDLAKLREAGRIDVAELYAPVVNALKNNNFVIAVFLAEKYELPQILVNNLKKIFKVRSIL